jgi:peptidoglycan hydrolase-like protein with peptidoglycan-binding domain
VRRRRLVAGGAAAAAAVVAGGVLLSDEAPKAAEPTATPSARATATVERLDLVDRESLSGTLGYADAGTLGAAAAGILTGIRDPGEVITRGHSLYDVNGAPGAFLFYGKLPAWRDFNSSMTDGEDVKQLEWNLKQLGYDPGNVDGDWDSDTTAAVKDFQDDRDLDDDGTLSRGEVVFRPGPTRMGEAKAEVGDSVAPGRPLASLSSTARRVTVQLDARRQQLARVGDKVTVDLPNGRSTTGRISDVGKVAAKASQDSDPTVEVTITLRSHGSNFDQAPVDVGFAVDKRKGVLAVPIKALLARQGGGYAVETTKGRFVTVKPGLYADDMVEVEGDLHEGDEVVTAQ